MWYVKFYWVCTLTRLGWLVGMFCCCLVCGYGCAGWLDIGVVLCFDFVVVSLGLTYYFVGLKFGRGCGSSGIIDCRGRC